MPLGWRWFRSPPHPSACSFICMCLFFHILHEVEAFQGPPRSQADASDISKTMRQKHQYIISFTNYLLSSTLLEQQKIAQGKWNGWRKEMNWRQKERGARRIYVYHSLHGKILSLVIIHFLREIWLDPDNWHHSPAILDFCILAADALTLAWVGSLHLGSEMQGGQNLVSLISNYAFSAGHRVSNWAPQKYLLVWKIRNASCYQL